MRTLMNKLLIFLVCSYLLVYVGIEVHTISACLLAFSISSLYTYLDTSRVTILLILSYTTLCFLFPVFGIYLPLFLYDLFLYRQYKTLAFLGLIGMFSLVNLSKELWMPFLFIYITSILLAWYYREIVELRQGLHQIRDRSTEAEISLRERNHALIQKQNAEIQAATLAERNRIAREIHDNVGHMLTRSILQMGALKVINKDPVLEEPISTLSETLNTAMTNIRNSVHDLHDESIDLEFVLKDLVQKTTSPHISLEYDVTHNVPREMKYAFISIIKESIQNMQKHSNADRAQICLREHPGMYHLQIRDNGTNLPKTISHNGIGLSNIEERVHALKGNLRIDTDNGFCITISIIK